MLPNLEFTWERLGKSKSLIVLAVILIFILSIFFSAARSVAINDVGSTDDTESFLPILLNDSEISSELPPTPPPPPLTLPEIVSFSASDLAILNGESTQLSWEISGEIDMINIDNNVGDVTGSNSVTVSPTLTTTYQLTVSNGAGFVTDEITIGVTEPEPPLIESFSAFETTIEEGESVTLTWSVSNYDTLTLNQGINDVTNQTSIVVSPTEDTTYRLKATNPYGEVTAQLNIEVLEANNSNQIVIYDWNKEVTTDDRGFPRNQPPNHNYDWTSPVNYAEGTLYVRAEINSIPVNQPDMYLQFCFWQELNGNNFALETCLKTENVPGQAGSVACWHQNVAQMWKLNGPLDWERPRYRVAVPIKVLKEINGKTDQYPVSNYNGWNWNGENPDHWYPMDIRFTAIVVEQGGTFSGWGAYGGCDSN